MIQKRVLVIGGNRFFGRHLTSSLLQNNYQVTLLNRGQHDDGFATRVTRIEADRTNQTQLENALNGQKWDFVFDQVCYTAKDARATCELLDGFADRVIFTSSQSVYGYGISISESEFDPILHSYSREVSAQEDYAEAKRQAESVFAKFDQLRPVMVRMPFVVGNDDYTGRLRWHVDRCAKRLPIYFPNVHARLGFIRSDMAGDTLLQIAKSDLVGPVNCACPGDIELKEFMQLVERKTHELFVSADTPNNENGSPYGVEKSWTMSIEKMAKAKIFLPDLRDWLPELIASS